MVQDITDRKLAEIQFTESEEKHASLYSSMSEGVGLHELIYDKDVKPVDYKIKIPSAMGMKIAEEVEGKIKAEYDPFTK